MPGSKGGMAWQRAVPTRQSEVRSSLGIPGGAHKTRLAEARRVFCFWKARSIMSESPPKRGFTTAILHSDRNAPVEHGSVHKPLHLAVAYGYADARELAAVFQGKAQGYSYGRQGNPTATALEEKITCMEGGVASVTFATGMAAIGAIMVSLLRAGDHVISSSFLFGNTNSLFETLSSLGAEVSCW